MTAAARRTPIILKLAGVFALLFCVAQVRAACTLSAAAVLPTRDEGAPFVFDATINGKPAKLAVETGSFRTTLNLGSASRLNVSLHETDGTTFGIGGTQHTWRGFVGQMQIGGMKADGWDLSGLDLWPEGARNGLDGHLGMDMMAAYDVDFDVPGQHVIIYEHDGDCRKPTVALAPPIYAAPLVEIHKDMQADVDVVIDGTHIRAILDSGMGHSAIFRAAAMRLGLDLSPLRAPGHPSERGMGPFDVAYFNHVFGVVQIGDLEFHNMSLRVLDQRDPGIDRHRVGSLLVDDSTRPSGQEMVLGRDFLQKVHVWLSHSSQRLIMQYPPRASVLPK